MHLRRRTDEFVSPTAKPTVKEAMVIKFEVGEQFRNFE